MTRRWVIPMALTAALLGRAAGAAPLAVHVVDARGEPLADAVVFLESPTASQAVRPARGVEIVQRDRRFVPAVTVVPVGTPVEFPNHDTVRHHVYSFSEAKRFEIKLYVGRPSSPVVFDRTGIAVLGCNIHDDMIAWVVVVDTPYHAKTDALGRAVLDAPAGAYRLRMWHASLSATVSPAAQPVMLTASGGSARVALTAASGH